MLLKSVLFTIYIRSLRLLPLQPPRTAGHVVSFLETNRKFNPNSVTAMFTTKKNFLINFQYFLQEFNVGEVRGTSLSNTNSERRQQSWYK